MAKAPKLRSDKRRLFDKPNTENKELKSASNKKWLDAKRRALVKKMTKR